MNSTFHPFVLPFCIGAIILFSILIAKFCLWLHRMSPAQKKQCLKNIISFRTFAAIWECIRECLFHRNIFKRNFVLGYMHLSFALGWFMLIVVGKAEASCYSHTFWEDPWMAIFFRYFENGSTDYFMPQVFTFVMDLLLAWVLSGVVLALCKRFYSRLLGMKKTTRHSWYDRIGILSLWCIFPCRLLAESVTAAVRHNGGWLTQTLGDCLSFLPVETLQLPLWWLYSSVLCTFFICLPFTRYMHIFAEMLLVFLRKWGVTEEEQQTGYTEFEINACSRCGICLDVCPLNTAADIHDTQSVYFIRDIRHNSLSEKIADNCLMCERCTEVCPVGIKTTLVRQIRRGQFKDNQSGKNYYEYLKGKQENGHRVVYFAGCMSHLAGGIIPSMLTIFKAAHEDYLFLDEEKNLCCGRPLRQQGYTEQADRMREKIETLIRESGAEVLVTSCPICYRSFKEEYHLNIQILHHTEYIQSLLDEGRLKPDASSERIAYHDPCELGRGAHIYEAPRKVLEAVGTLCRVPSEKKDSLCCGHSLADTTLDTELKNKVRDEALETLMSDHPDILATACPLCKKAFQCGQRIQVKDIAEIVARQLR